MDINLSKLHNLIRYKCINKFDNFRYNFTDRNIYDYLNNEIDVNMLVLLIL